MRPLRPADPDLRHADDRRPAGVVLAVVVGALLAAAFLDAPRLLADSEAKPLGAPRDRWLSVWEPVDAVASAVGIAAAHDAADTVLGRAETPTITIVASPTTATTVDPSDPSASTVPLAMPGESTTTTAPATTTTTEAVPPTVRPATASEPLDVLILGDSTVRTVGQAGQRWFVESGVAVVRLDERPATGLSRPDFFDWPSHVAAVAAADPPELVVAMFGANDAQSFMHEDRAVSYGSDEWIAVYRARVAAVMDLFIAADPDVVVVWVGQPVMRSDDFDGRMRLLNSIYAEEAAARPRVAFFDSRPVLANANDAYRSTGPGVDGTERTLRESDGIHLTVAGGELLFAAVAAELEAELGFGG